MFRPLRIEFEGAFYHVMARGNARQSIFPDEDDRHSSTTWTGFAKVSTGWFGHGV
jgi:hypothetical protein